MSEHQCKRMVSGVVVGQQRKSPRTSFLCSHSGGGAAARRARKKELSLSAARAPRDSKKASERPQEPVGPVVAGGANEQ